MPDPDTLLANVRMLTANTQASHPVGSLHWSLMRAVQELDAHLTAGGELPAAWAPAGGATPAIPDPPEDEPGSPDTVFAFLDVIAELERQRPDLTAYVEQTGGWVMCIYAARRSPDGGPPETVLAEGGEYGCYPVIAGPGWIDRETGISYGGLGDFSIALNTPEMDWQPPTDAPGDYIASPMTDDAASLAQVIGEYVDRCYELRARDGVTS